MPFWKAERLGAKAGGSQTTTSKVSPASASAVMVSKASPRRVSNRSPKPERAAPSYCPVSDGVTLPRRAGAPACFLWYDRHIEKNGGSTLRNVLKRYMETEAHEQLFPVIATCLHLSQREVEEILSGRERRISTGFFTPRR